jgi:hypothetical protein
MNIFKLKIYFIIIYNYFLLYIYNKFIILSNLKERLNVLK